MRLIDADELKKCVLKWLPQDPCGREEKEIPFETDICVSMLMEIDEQPTIQPKKGKWIEYEQEFMLEEPLKTVQKTVRECSVCTAKIAGMVGIMNYCPNCGADMREVTK